MPVVTQMRGTTELRTQMSHGARRSTRVLRQVTGNDSPTPRLSEVYKMTCLRNLYQLQHAL